MPSRTVPQGISALLACNMQGELAQNVANMNRALARVDTGEVTIAVRDAHLDGMDVRAGAVIGLLNDVLSAEGATPDEVVFTLLQQMDATEAEVITIFFGDLVDEAAAEALGQSIEAAYPEQAVEVVFGGQPHYHYIISAE